MWRQVGTVALHQVFLPLRHLRQFEILRRSPASRRSQPAAPSPAAPASLRRLSRQWLVAETKGIGAGRPLKSSSFDEPLRRVILAPRAFGPIRRASGGSTGQVRIASLRISFAATGECPPRTPVEADLRRRPSDARSGSGPRRLVRPRRLNPEWKSSKWYADIAFESGHGLARPRRFSVRLNNDE
jgi:hypothetical protein